MFSSLGLQPASDPIIVRIIAPPPEISGLADVLLGALGITGVIALGAVLLGLGVAAIMFWIRSRAA